LRPCLKSIILSLLPGLEDETSEDFEDVVRVLDKFREASKETENDAQIGDKELVEERDSYFWQCFFLAVITSPSRRQGALAVLVRSLPKFATTSRKAGGAYADGTDSLKSLPAAAQAALSPEPGLLIRCFSAGLSDKQLLVQRGFLDMLVTHLPLDSAVLQYAVPKADLDRLIFAAAGVVSRRDMSLNRRLWAWFLGPEPTSELENTPISATDVKSPTVDLSSHHAAYFARYGLRSLTRSILALFDRKIASPSERARPFRICLSLMDRWEVGGLLIPDLFIPAMTNAYEYSQTASKVEVDEVIKSASIFFDGVESGLIWAKFFELATAALKEDKVGSKVDGVRNLELCAFVIQRFNLREDEMVLYHMPLTALSILILLNRQVKRPVGHQVRALALDVVEKLVNMIPERAFIEPEKVMKGRPPSDVLGLITQFYEQDQGTIEGTEGLFASLSPAVVGSRLLREALTFFIHCINASAATLGMDSTTKLVCSLLPKIPDAVSALREVNLLASLRTSLTPNNSRSGQINFSVLASVTTVIGMAQQVTIEHPYITAPELLDLQNTLIEMLWDYLSPLHPKYHVEAVRYIWHLEAIPSSNRCVEASLTRLISLALRSPGLDARISPADGARHFAVLWTHSMQEKSTGGEKNQRAMIRRTSSIAGLNGAISIPSDPSSVLARPLLLLLDSLAEDGTELFTFVNTWLQHLSALPRVFDILISQIQALKCFRMPTKTKKQPRRTLRPSDAGDSKECLHYMRHVYGILKNASEHTWLTVAGEMIEPHYQQGDEQAERVPLHILLVQICLRVLDTVSLVPQETESDHISQLQQTALEIILLLVQGPFSAPLKDLHLELPLLDRLQQDLAKMDPLLQMSLLSAITAALKLQFTNIPPLPKSPHQRKFSRDLTPTASTLSLTKDRGSTDTLSALRVAPPPSLVECLKAGFSSPSSRIILDSWVSFLVEILPLFADTIFQNLIPLVECFCSQIGIVFDQLRTTFRQQSAGHDIASPEPTLISLMNGLEQILARAHDRLVTDELKVANAKSPDQPQGFFGNMVQGVFNTESSQQPTRTATANSRLAVLLCFQDTVRTCFGVWSWGVYGAGSLEKQDPSSFASFGYTSLRMRNRARRLLEHLFAAEALECLETLTVLFVRPPSKHFQPESVTGLLNVLNGSRPKHTIPAIFNAIYSRTNPTALDVGRMSSLTSELSDIELTGFLVEYLESIEDDAMDEVWTDCMAFLKDVLANPLLHSQILPDLIGFIRVLAEKVERTGFGGERKMRRDLGVSTYPFSS
jgi:hypothetical protein